MKRPTIGILTSGGDCPGLNAAIRGVGKTAILKYGMKVVGIVNGYQGLINREVISLDEKQLSGIMTLGGTILGTSREKPFKTTDVDGAAKPQAIKKNYEKLGLDAVVCIGGNGTMKTAHKLAKIGLNVIGVPKTIDNDIFGTDQTFGFDSAVQIVTEALDRLHTTANSHRRIMVVEVMGHTAGWLALNAGIAGGGDVILIPEIPCSSQVVADYLSARAKAGKPYSIVVVAEGVRFPGSEMPAMAAGTANSVIDGCPEPVGMSAGVVLAREIKRLTGLEVRETILGYIQRGGTPSHNDRVLATRLGTKAAELIAAGNFGTMAALRGTDIVAIPLADVAGRVKGVPPDHQLVQEARMLGTCFGDA